MQCKYYQILLGQTCEWSLWRGGRFIEVVFKTGSTVHWLLTSNFMPPITVFITIAGHTLPIEIDTGALISLLNWETFQKVNHGLDISLLLTESKLKTYSGEIVSPKGKS